MKTSWMRNIALAVCAAFLVTGCATSNDVQPGKGMHFTVKNRSYDQVWNAAVTTVGSQLTILESDKKSGVIKAESRAGMATWGEVVGVFINTKGKKRNKHMVEVVSMTRGKLQVTGQSWEKTIAEGIKARLGK